MLSFLRVLALLLVATSAVCARGLFPDALIVKRANAWKPGEPVPDELLHYQPPADMPVDGDTIAIYLSISNYSLFLQIVRTPGDPRINKLAADQALELGGPNRFFTDLRAYCRAHPEWLADPEHRALAERAKRRHVVVESLFAGDSDMAPKTADGVFNKAAAELRAGADFGRVAEKYVKAYPAANGWQSCIGIESEQTLVEPDASGATTPATAKVPPALVRRLLGARAGDVLIAHDPKTRQTLLYRVKEVYVPPVENGTKRK